MGTFIRYWLPVLAWMAVIFILSTSRFSFGHTARFIEPLLRLFFPAIAEDRLTRAHIRIREGAHFVEYLILGVLLFRAARGDSEVPWLPGWMFLSFLVTTAYAILDELHQKWESGRTARLGHVLIDIAGGATAQALIFLAVGVLS